MIKKARKGFFLCFYGNIFATVRFAFLIIKIDIMKMKRILLFAAVICVFAACSKETPSVHDISLSVSEPAGEDLGDRDFSVYVVAKKSSSGENLSSDRLYDGILAENNGGTLLFPETPAYDAGRPYCDFYVFSPYKENLVPAGVPSAEIRVEQDQSEGLAESDVLFGKTVNFIRRENDPHVELGHLFSRLDFVIETSNPVGAFDWVTMKNVLLGGVYDAEDCYFSPSPFTGDVKSCGQFVLSDDGLLRGVSVIVPPQELAAGDFATIMIGGEEHSLKLDQNLVLEAGKVAEISFSVTAELNPELRVDVSVRDWENETMDFTSGKLLPPGNTVTDIDGNEYPVVKIGSQYWMGSNLRTTKLNDGTDIYRVESLDEWPVTDKEAYTVYELDFENNPDRWGLLYNRMCVEYEKLCPEGWHVPTTTDWDMLGMSQGGVPDEASCIANVTEDLKSTDGWLGCPGTNETGFDGYPVGYLFSYISGYNGDTPVYFSGFAYNGETAGWWSTSGYWSESVFFRAFVYHSYDMQRYSVPSLNAFPVRCVSDYVE